MTGPVSGKPPAPIAEVAKRQKRSDRLAARIRMLIVEAGLKPGDRIPQQWLTEEERRAARGTVREAIKALETQGLVKTRTGPGGGVFVAALSGEQAIGLVGNLFLFNPPSLQDIHALRAILEPELAADLAGRLDEPALVRLRAAIRLNEEEPRTAAQELALRLAALDFHAALANESGNRVLGFVCVFLHSLMRDLAQSRAPEVPANLPDAALDYQPRLLRAIRSGDRDAARAVMQAHLKEFGTYLDGAATLRARPDEAQ
jgi:GntR family transcriptional repressor for pyruvate dehydrogenase complex